MCTSFQDFSLRKLDCDAPIFEPPKEIGYFSVDIDMKFVNSKQYLRYFIEPPNPGSVDFDLHKGFETSIIKAHGNNFHILRWIKENIENVSETPNQTTERRLAGASGADGPMQDIYTRRQVERVVAKESTEQDPGSVQAGLSKLKIDKNGTQSGAMKVEKRSLNTDFVSRRGILAKIMITPYETEERKIAVIRYNGTYYLDEIIPEDRKRRNENQKGDKMTCLGWKFEQYLTADCKNGVPNTDEPYNNCEAFYTVVKTQLNGHSLMFSGEVDAIHNNGHYIEFKTNKEFRHKGHEVSWKRYKTRKWWAQSYLIGVKEIVCGFRDDEGVVKSLGFFKTEELPKISSDINNGWKPNVCTNFLDQFLSFLKSSIKTDDHKIVHTLQLTRDKGVIECSLLQPDPDNYFLPQWYIDETA